MPPVDLDDEAIKTLKPKKGDLLVFRLGNTFSRERFKTISQALQIICLLFSCQYIILTAEEDLSIMTDEQVKERLQKMREAEFRV